VSADHVAQVILEMMLVMRILRIGRLFQVLNHFKPMRILWLALLASSYELMVLAMVCTVATFFFSTLIYYAEGRRNLDTSKFISIPVGLWYTNTQIQRLARPAAPLAACVQRINCTSYRTTTPSTEYDKTKLNSEDEAN